MKITWDVEDVKKRVHTNILRSDHPDTQQNDIPIGVLFPDEEMQRFIVINARAVVSPLMTGEEMAAWLTEGRNGSSYR